MDMLSHLTDDQIALLGCAGALILSGTAMSLSYYVGRFRSRTSHSQPSAPELRVQAVDDSGQSKKDRADAYDRIAA